MTRDTKQNDIDLEFGQHECSICGTDCSFVSDQLDENHERIARLEAQLATATEPDMFWDADDSERCEDSIREIVYERGLEIVEVMTATRGETVFAFLTGDDELEPEVVHVFNTLAEAESAIRALIDPPAKEPK
jgi:hypothetical protein